jgi:hypothetical protein
LVPFRAAAEDREARGGPDREMLMRFLTPRGETPFSIPDEWWEFVVMNDLPFNHPHFYLYDGEKFPDAEIIRLWDIEPPRKTPDVQEFLKYKLVPVLLAFFSPEYSLGPVEVTRQPKSPYKYRLTRGFHRYYASVAIGYSMIPAIVRAEPKVS